MRWSCTGFEISGTRVATAVRGHPFTELSIIILGIIFLSYGSQVLATTTLAWSESPLTITVMAGTSTSVSVELEASSDLSDVALSVGPALASFVSVYPTTLPTLVAGVPQTVSLGISIPADTPLGTYEGTLHVKQGKRTLATPLPVVIDVIQLASTQDPVAILIPSHDRVVEDAHSGAVLVKDEIMITMSPSAPPHKAQDVAATLGGILIGGHPELRRYQIFLPGRDITDLGPLVQEARSIVDTESASEHFFGTNAESPEDGNLGGCTEFSGSWQENPPSGCNWAHKLLRLPSAWDITKGSPTLRIGVIDSGFFNQGGSRPWHVDFYDYDDANVPTKSNIALAYLRDTDPEHGTFVAGILGAKGNNRLGITGAMWDVSMALCTAAVQYPIIEPLFSLELVRLCAQRMNVFGARVINFSGMFTCSSDPFGICARMRETWGEILDQVTGSLVVAAAGNEGRPVEERLTTGLTQYSLPAALATTADNLISVAAVQEFGQSMWRDSNYGAAVTIAAPGSFIASLAPDDKYAFSAGTSFAAPFVSGIAGLVLSVNGALTPRQVKEILETGAREGGRSVTTPAGDKTYIANAYESVQLAKTWLPSTAFAMGDAVEVAYDGVPVTDTPAGATLTERMTGERGTVVGGPVYAGGYWWWQVNFDNDPDGWVQEIHLRKVGGGGDGPMRIEDVPFEDANLRSCVLALWSGVSTDSVSHVYCWDGYASNSPWVGVSSLQGMEYLPNVNELLVSGGSITSLAPLAELKKLSRIVLDDHKISDLTPLKELSALEVVEMSDNNISDLRPLSGIKNLRSLALNNNNISDLGPLAGLTNLTVLWLSQNKISDLRHLAGLTKLWDLSLWKNEISDLSPLSNLVTLNWLDLQENKITNVRPLFNLTKLIALTLWGNNGIRCDELDALKSALTALEDGRWGRRASCVTSVNGMCGPINGGQCSSSLSSSSWGLCDAGTVTDFRFSSGRWRWTCAGSGGGTSASCSETRCSTTTTVNGVCGALVGDGFCSTGLTASSPGLCSKGTVSTFSTYATFYGWNCLGQNGGSDTICLESRCN